MEQLHGWGARKPGPAARFDSGHFRGAAVLAILCYWPLFSQASYTAVVNADRRSLCSSHSSAVTLN